MTVEIREFRVEDYAAAWRLWASMEGVGLGSSDTLEAIARFLERNPGLSQAAVDGPALIGTILCGHDGRRGFVHHLAVAPGYQRQGIGRKLVAGSLLALREAEIVKCHLLVFNANEAGRAFWARIGAEERVTLTTFSVSTGNGADGSAG